MNWVSCPGLLKAYVTIGSVTLVVKECHLLVLNHIILLFSWGCCIRFSDRVFRCLAIQARQGRSTIETLVECNVIVHCFTTTATTQSRCHQINRQQPVSSLHYNQGTVCTHWIKVAFIIRNSHVPFGDTIVSKQTPRTKRD